jgi:hypothetical protein
MQMHASIAEAASQRNGISVNPYPDYFKVSEREKIKKGEEKNKCFEEEEEEIKIQTSVYGLTYICISTVLGGLKSCFPYEPKTKGTF